MLMDKETRKALMACTAILGSLVVLTTMIVAAFLGTVSPAIAAFVLVVWFSLASGINYFMTLDDIQTVKTNE